MSHPLLAGIITSINPGRRGMAMGLNGFMVSTGFGLGSLLFQMALRLGVRRCAGDLRGVPSGDGRDRVGAVQK